MHKENKVNNKASSRFGCPKCGSPSASGISHAVDGTRRTIAYFFDIGGRDEVKTYFS